MKGAVEAICVREVAGKAIGSGRPPCLPDWSIWSDGLDSAEPGNFGLAGRDACALRASRCVGAAVGEERLLEFGELQRLRDEIIHARFVAARTLLGIR